MGRRLRLQTRSDEGGRDLKDILQRKPPLVDGDSSCSGKTSPQSKHAMRPAMPLIRVEKVEQCPVGVPPSVEMSRQPMAARTCVAETGPGLSRPGFEARATLRQTSCRSERWFVLRQLLAFAGPCAVDEL